MFLKNLRLSVGQLSANTTAYFFVNTFGEEIHLKNEAVDIYDAFSVEFKLVLLCSYPKIEEVNRQAINHLLAETIDWNLFLDLAERHRVYPLIYQCLAALSNSAVPDRIITVLRKIRWENTSKTLQMTGELVNVLQAMEENEVRVVVLKGFPLGFVLYSNLSLRPSRDLDILVWPDDVDNAIKVIENQGYERIYPSPVVEYVWLRDWMKTNHHFEYWHKDKEILLELHWRLGHYGMEMPLSEIENCLTQVTIAGHAVCILGTEELLVFLVLHGASHAWFRLKWLCDVGVILRQGRFSWERLYALSERLGIEALLNQAVILAQHLLHAPVPDNIARRITKDRKALNLAGMVLPFIASVSYAPVNLKIGMPLYYHSKKYEFSVQLGCSKKLAYLYNKLLPRDRHIELIALPGYLYLLYYLLRSFNWCNHRVMKLARR